MRLENWIPHTACKTPEKVAISCQGTDLSYAELDSLIGRLAGLLR